MPKQVVTKKVVYREPSNKQLKAQQRAKYHASEGKRGAGRPKPRPPKGERSS